MSRGVGRGDCLCRKRGVRSVSQIDDLESTIYSYLEQCAGRLLSPVFFLVLLEQTNACFWIDNGLYSLIIG